MASGSTNLRATNGSGAAVSHDAYRCGHVGAVRAQAAMIGGNINPGDQRPIAVTQLAVTNGNMDPLGGVIEAVAMGKK